MNQERRFLLALGLVVAILGIWSLLSPPAPTPPPRLPAEKEIQILSQPAPPEPIIPVEIGSFTLGVGKVSGGIQQLRVDGVELLREAEVPFLGVQLPSHLQPLVWQEVSRPGILTHEAVLPEQGLRLIHRVSSDENRSNFLLEAEIQIMNQGKQSQDVDLRYLVYRPLKVQHPEDQQYLSGTAKLDGKQVNLRLRRGGSRTWEKLPHWITSQGKSHALVMQPVDGDGMFHVEHSASGLETGWLLFRRELSPGETDGWKLQIYAGPMQMAALRQAGVEEAVSFGAFSGIALFLLQFLHWSYGWLHNYGLAICLLSFAVWLPFAPLTWYSMRMSSRTMEKMAMIKPQEARIRREFQSNPQRMQQELLELYRKHGINPASGCLGCLPLLVTMPVYIALFQVLNRAPELRNAGFLWIRDLSAPDGLIRFPAAIPLLGESLNILPLIATVATYFQQTLMQRPAGGLTEEQRVQQQIFKFFPLMLMVFFYSLPSGFMIYWTVNSTLMVGQQLLISRRARR